MVAQPYPTIQHGVLAFFEAFPAPAPIADYDYCCFVNTNAENWTHSITLSSPSLRRDCIIAGSSSKNSSLMSPHETLKQRLY